MEFKDINELRMFVGFVVTESTLPKESKLTLIRKLEHLGENDLLSYAKTSHFQKVMSSVNVNEQMLRTATKAAVIGATGIGSILFGLKRVTQAMFSKCSRACGTFGIGFKRNMCLAQCKVQLADAEMRDIQKAGSACAKASNPAKCREGVNKKAMAARDRAAKARQKLVDLKTKAAQKGWNAGTAGGNVDTSKTNIVGRAQ